MWNERHLSSGYQKYTKLTTSYTENKNGQLAIETNSFMYSDAPCRGSFITTAIDLGKWNQLYFEENYSKRIQWNNC